MTSRSAAKRTLRVRWADAEGSGPPDAGDARPQPRFRPSRRTLLTAGGVTAGAAALAMARQPAAEAQTGVNAIIYAPAPSGDTTGKTDTPALQAILSAMSAGQTLQFTQGGYWINAALQIPDNVSVIGPACNQPPKPRSVPVATPFPATITVAGTSTLHPNLDAILTDTAFLGTGTATPSYGIMIRGMILDGNSASQTGYTANQTGGLGHGIALMTQASEIRNCTVQNTYGSGIVIADQNNGGSGVTISCVENRIRENNVYLPGNPSNTNPVYGIWVQGNTGHLTDGYVEDNIIDDDVLSTGFTTGSAISIEMDNAPGWRIFRNHVYALNGNGMVFQHCNETWICDNLIDNFGQLSASDATYIGYDIAVTPFGRTTIRGNKADAAEANGAGKGKFVYYSISAGEAGQQNEIVFTDNAVRQVSATSTAKGSTAYAFNSGSGGTLWVQGFFGTSQISPVGTASTTATPQLTGTVEIPGNSG
jgi:hypothetical protein